MKNSTFHSQLFCSSATFILLMVSTQAYAQNAGSVESVVVTSTREQAQESKKDAPNVEDVQSLEAIRALPDVNAAEALERIPGVSLESDSGEGRFVNIRGMDADLNGTTYDGVRLTASNPASPQGGGRAVAFDAFPSGILGGIEVVKSLTPEMDAEGLGGVVNILPRSIAPGKDTIIDGTIGTGIEPLRGTPVWQADVTAGTRFGLTDGDQRFSIIGSYSLYDDQRGIDDVEADYLNDPSLPPKTFDDLQLRYYKYHRTRQGIGGGLTFDVNDDTSLYIHGIHAGYTELAFKHRLEIDGLGDDVTNIDPNGAISVDTASALTNITDSKETVSNDLLDFGGHTIIADIVKADFLGSWTRGSDKVAFSDSIKFKDPNDISLVYNNANPSYPSFQIQDGTDLTNPANYTKFSGSNGPGENSDQEWAGKANFSFPLSVFDDNGIFKFGGGVRERTRKAIAFSADFDKASGSYADFSDGVDRIYYNGHYNIGPSPLYAKLAALPQGDQEVDPSTFEDDNENVYAGYVQYSASFGKLEATGGLRLEETQGTYRANTQDADSGDFTPNVAKRNYTNLFPDLNLKYAVDDQLQFRAAYSTAIARPGFNQSTAARTISVADGTASQGNPDLKPTTANSFDLTAEYYMPDDGVASIGLFYKDFANYIITTVQNDATNVPGFPADEHVQITGYQNIGGAKAQGIEMNYRQRFAFLPDPFDGLGFEGNMTLVGSSGQIRLGEKHTLPQTSSINYNAAIFYEKGPFDLRLAAGYVSRNLFSVAEDASGDVYSQPRFRLDFGGSYEITPNISYYLDVKDITDTKLTFTQTASPNYPIQREFYGPTYLTGIRIRFD